MLLTRSVSDLLDARREAQHSVDVSSRSSILAYEKHWNYKEYSHLLQRKYDVNSRERHHRQHAVTHHGHDYAECNARCSHQRQESVHAQTAKSSNAINVIEMYFSTLLKKKDRIKWILIRMHRKYVATRIGIEKMRIIFFLLSFWIGLRTTIDAYYRLPSIMYGNFWKIHWQPRQKFKSAIIYHKNYIFQIEIRNESGLKKFTSSSPKLKVLFTFFSQFFIACLNDMLTQ